MKKFIKHIIIALLVIIYLIFASYILNDTHTKISLPLGLLLLDLPFFVFLVIISIYFILRVKTKNTSDKICLTFILIIIPAYFYMRILPLTLDIFSKIEVVELSDVSIYYRVNHNKFSTGKQYYIKGYDDKKGYTNFMIRVEDYALETEKKIKEDKLTKVYYYKYSKYVYKIVIE